MSDTPFPPHNPAQIIPTELKRVLLSMKVRGLDGEEMGRQTVVVHTDGPMIIRPDLQYVSRRDGKKYPLFLELEFCVEEL